MNLGVVRKVGNDCCIHIRETYAWVLGEDVTSACFTPFAITVRRLVVSADVFRSLRNLHRFGFP